METYSHAFFTWALAKHGVKAGRAAGIAGAVGAALPDVPSFAGTAYYIGPVYLRDGWTSMETEEVLQAIYFSPFGGAGSALHSAAPAVALLVLYRFLHLKRRDRRKILMWFLLGWLGHTVADFLTHVDDARPHFWSLSGWTWSSPVSYYNSAYHGREFFLANHGLMLPTMLALLVARLRRGKGREDGAR
ncbi:MAG TPA: hypothetical protein VKA73_02560 [Rubrobacter sp.]|nr:hypothetical protein [Rubrobacter sp.]